MKKRSGIGPIHSLYKSVIVFFVLGFIFFLLCYIKSFIGPAYGESTPLPAFGKGPIKVNLYTDYFCLPCRDLEPKIEPILVDLMNQGLINLTFVDTPTSPYTSLYARYFIYALNVNKDFDHALLARNALFEAAESMIIERRKLEDFLKSRGVELKPVDVSPVLGFWNQNLKEDNISSTPSCVIVNGEKKEYFKGPVNVLKALQGLKGNAGRGNESGRAMNQEKRETPQN